MNVAADYVTFLQHCQAAARDTGRTLAVEIDAADVARALAIATADAAHLHRRAADSADGLRLLAVHVAEGLTATGASRHDPLRLAFDGRGLVWAASRPPAHHPVLLDGELCLDAPDPGDAAAWSAAQDEECARWFDWPAPPGTERCRQYLAGLSPDDTDAYVWAIRRADALLGGIDLRRLPERWNVSYFVHPAHRGEGIATRALGQVGAWAFAALRLDALTTRVHVDNTASIRVLQRCGFVHTGREASRTGAHDDDCYTLTAPAAAG